MGALCRLTSAFIELIFVSGPSCICLLSRPWTGNIIGKICKVRTVYVGGVLNFAGQERPIRKIQPPLDGAL